jgi:hypothetical protein
MYYLITMFTLTGRVIPLTIRRDTFEAAFIAAQQIVPGALMTLERIW